MNSGSSRDSLETIECSRRSNPQASKSTKRGLGQFVSQNLKRAEKSLQQPPSPSHGLGTISVIRTPKKHLFKKNDIVIAVMGPAGSGKSSFIQTATGQDLGVCHDLLIQTTEIAAVRVPLTDVINVILIDTPGFNDTDPSSLGLKRVSDWLEKVYGRGVQLSGILYIQSINDKRGGNMLQKNLDVFQKLCGRGGIRRIIIATTMWSGIHSEAGAKRENELKCGHWARAIKGGSGLLRFDRTRESAWLIIGHILTLEFDHRRIQTQAELAALRVDLPDTAIGQQLADLTEDLVKNLQAIRTRMKEKVMETPDSEAMEELCDELNRLRVNRVKVSMGIRQIDPPLLGRLECLLEGTVEASTRTVQATSSFLQDQCRNLIPRISEKKDQSGLISQLTEGEAQQIIDFLSTVLHEVEDLGTEDWKRVLSLYLKLAKVAQVYPQCYQLKGIQYETAIIAEGGFARVHKGTHQNQQICLKIVKKSSYEVLRTCIKELTLWAHLSHRNILPFFGVYTIGETSQICLVSPWMKHGNLHDYVNEKPQIPRMPWICDIADGLIYLHQLGIVHCDLKAQNILVSDDERALIADFGLSYTVMTTTKQSAGVGGTTRWMAPELFDENPENLTKACDAWSFSCLCYEILSRTVPFYQHRLEAQVINALQRQKLPRRPERKHTDCDEIDNWMWDLMMKCWNFTPQDRPTLEEVRELISPYLVPLDNGPEMVGGRYNVPAFRKAVKMESKIEIDLERVYQVLCRIQETVSS